VGEVVDFIQFKPFNKEAVMPLKDEVTVGEAREEISSFLKGTGCYDICANCPIYGEDGCCHGCSHLVRGKGCGAQNISCLSYTCGVLNMHLSRIPDEEHGNKLTAFTELLYGLPREGYRGCDRREPTELLQIADPLEINAVVSVPEALEKEE
jgi:hypothetical protein